MGSRPTHTRVLPETDFGRWRAFVASAPSGSIYSDPDYLDTLCVAAGGRFQILAAFRGEEIVGGVGLYETAMGACRVVGNRLLLYYNGLVLKPYASKYPSQVAARHLKTLASLEAAIGGFSYDHVTLHNRHEVEDLRPFLKEGWMVRPSYSYLLGLTDMAKAFKRIDQNQRRLIRRSEGEGVYLSEDEDFSAFFAMHRATSERKGIPLYLDETAFSAFFRTLRKAGLCRLFHARLPNGRSVASQLVLTGDHPISHTVAAASNPEFSRLGTTPFLRWKACEALAAEGCEGNDLTDAALNEVTRFKSQLGGELVRNSVLSTKGSRRFRARKALSRVYRRSRGLGGTIYRRLRSRTNA